MQLKLRLGVRSAALWGKQSARWLSSMTARLCHHPSCSRESGGQHVPSRSEQIKSLKTEIFDVLVVGGGAVGCGCALESASRGLKTALIEGADFGSGASCKSSKLIEGSNSYLNAAIQGADLQQIFMLKQVLKERAIMLSIAPHLNRIQPMLMPIYSPLQLPIYWLGLKVYDAMAGMSNVRGSHFLSKEATLNEFPLLQPDGLLGSLVYYDVQFDDARMCLALAMTAVKQGATVANYVRLLGMSPLKGKDKSRSVCAQDTTSGKTFTIRSRTIVNATGADTDVIRKMDCRNVMTVAVPKLGTHIALPCYYGSPNCGLLFPSNGTSNTALIMLPFEDRLVVGSLDVEQPEANFSTEPSAETVKCLLAQTREVLDDHVQLRYDQVLSAWTGRKPDILCPCALDDREDTQPCTVPNFLLEVSDSQMITLAGGRWSNYRLMAVDAINMAIEMCRLEPQSEKSISSTLLLDGADNFSWLLPLDLVQAYDLPMDVAQHLTLAYGSNASRLLDSVPSGRERLHPKFPYIQAEVTYACQREYAVHVVDVIARRLRVAFVDASAAAEMLPAVLEVMGQELSWVENQRSEELDMAREFLDKQMGLGYLTYTKQARERSVNPLQYDQKECPDPKTETRDVTLDKNNQSMPESRSNQQLKKTNNRSSMDHSRSSIRSLSEVTTSKLKLNMSGKNDIGDPSRSLETSSDQKNSQLHMGKAGVCPSGLMFSTNRPMLKTRPRTGPCSFSPYVIAGTEPRGCLEKTRLALKKPSQIEPPPSVLGFTNEKYGRVAMLTGPYVKARDGETTALPGDHDSPTSKTSNLSCDCRDVEKSTAKIESRSDNSDKMHHTTVVDSSTSVIDEDAAIPPASPKMADDKGLEDIEVKSAEEILKKAIVSLRQLRDTLNFITQSSNGLDEDSKTPSPTPSGPIKPLSHKHGEKIICLGRRGNKKVGK